MDGARIKIPKSTWMLPSPALLSVAGPRVSAAIALASEYLLCG